MIENRNRYSNLHALFSQAPDNDNEFVRRKDELIKLEIEEQQRKNQESQARQRDAEQAYQCWLQKKSHERRARSQGRNSKVIFTNFLVTHLLSRRLWKNFHSCRRKKLIEGCKKFE